VEPCADHTTRIYEIAGGGFTPWALARLSAHDGLHSSEYFQDTSGFEYLMGSIDQRSLRDWG
jgi:hypothetical protein